MKNKTKDYFLLQKKKFAITLKVKYFQKIF